MKKRNLMPLFFVVVLFTNLIFIAGCQTKGTQKQTSQVQFHVGSQGLVMNFVPNAPPNRVYHTDPSALDVRVEIKNRGALTVQPGDVFFILEGYDPNIMPFLEYQQQNPKQEIPGKSALNPVEGIDFITWNNPPTINLPSVSDVYRPILQVRSCYRYKTEASPTVCIDPQPYATVPTSKICIVSDQTLSGGQGAPIAVTRIEETILGAGDQSALKRAQFKITASNVGGGRVVKFDTLQKCINNKLEYDEFNKVEVEAYIGNTRLECNPNTISLLTNNQGFTFCTYSDIRRDAAYTTPLQIILSYGYSQTIQKSVEIVRTPGVK